MAKRPGVREAKTTVQGVRETAAMAGKKRGSTKKPKTGGPGVSPNWAKLQQELQAVAPAGSRKPRKKQFTGANTERRSADHSSAATKSDAAPNRPRKTKRVADPKASAVRVLQGNNTVPSTPEELQARLTGHIAIDCEMVGVGEDGVRSMLARVSIVNYDGDVLYDAFVQPVERVTDYRTKWSGVRPRDLRPEVAKTFKEVQQEVSYIMKDRYVVGHALSNDFAALLIDHPRMLQRDTSRCAFLRRNSRPQKLRDLVKFHLGADIQGGEHSSIEDARATMALFRHVRVRWDKLLVKQVDRKREKRNKKQAARMQH